MNIFIAVSISILIGLILGGAYFIGLWLTVKKVIGQQKGKGFIFLSFLLRIAVLLTGFYIVMQGDALRLVAALIGFIFARQLILLRVKKLNYDTIKVRN